MQVLVAFKKQIESDQQRLQRISYIQGTVHNQLGVIIGGEELYAKLLRYKPKRLSKSGAGYYCRLPYSVQGSI